MIKSISDATHNKVILLHILLIALLGSLIYSNSINGQFIRDDHELVENNVYLKSWRYLPRIFTENVGAGAGLRSNSYRPLQILSYMIGYSLYGLDVRGYHISNVLLHIFVGAAVYWLIMLLFNDRTLSFFAAAMYVAHPLHTGAVAYISGRADPMVFLCVLLSFIFYIKHTRSKGTRLYYGLSLLFFVFALLSKEVALVFALLLLLYHAAFKERINIRLFIPIVIITFLYIAARLTVFSHFVSYSADTTTSAFQRMPGFFVALVNYLVLLVSPVYLKIDYGNVLFGVTHPKVIVGMSMAVLAIFYAFRSRGSNRLVFFSIGWFFITLGPSSNIYFINSYMAEHWLYMPSMGFCLLVSGLFLHIYRNARLRKISVAFFLLMVLMYGHLTVVQNGHWRDPLAFYKKILCFNPDLGSAYNGLGLAYQEKGLQKDAGDMFKRAIQKDPGDAVGYINLALIYHDLGRDGEAISLLKRAIVVNPTYAKGYNNLAMIYHGLGRNEEAKAFYESAITLNPNYSKAYYNLANLHYDMGDKEKSISLYKESIRLDPEYHKSYFNLGLAYQDLGNIEEAETFYKKAIFYRKDYVNAYLNLASLYQENGRNEEALELYQRAIGISPDFEQLYYNLGNAYRQLGRNSEAISSYNKAIDLKEDFFDVHYNLGNTHFDTGDYAKAASSYRRALEFRRDFVDAHYNLGNAYVALGEIDEAIESYKRALTLDPNSAEIHINLATAYFIKGDIDLAIEHCDEAEILGVVDRKLSDALSSYKH
ncbi:MAG: tetratricopeptide repeat protein [Candidatus Omnitrophica bacterium]|nr:tetratricopeptide repeat protein [Candidatus Omnitrophota bacterium]